MIETAKMTSIATGREFAGVPPESGRVEVPYGMFQNIDPKSVTFVDVLRHFPARRRKMKGRNRVLYKIVNILVVK